MNSWAPLGIGIAVIAIVGGFVYIQNSDRSTTWQVADEAEKIEQEVSPSAQRQQTDQKKSISSAEVAQHASASSCWSIINGSVYDLTAWISRHPGGQQAILQLCGKDGSAEFNGQHGGAAQQAHVLATFKIGELAR